MPAFGHGVGIEAEQFGDLLITAVAQEQGLKAGVQAALLLVEQTEEQHDGSLGLLGYGFRQRSAAWPRRLGLHHAPRQKLLLAQRRFGGTIQESMGERLARQKAEDHLRKTNPTVKIQWHPKSGI